MSHSPVDPSANPGIVVRDATEADRPAVAHVMDLATRQLRTVYRPTPQAVAHARGKPTEWLVASVGDEVVGALRYAVEDDRLHLGLGVHSNHRRNGVARAMIETLAAKAKSRGLRKLSLYTVRQTGNVAIFSRLGFSVVSEEPAQGIESVAGVPLSDVYMERVLGDEDANGTSPPRFA